MGVIAPFPRRGTLSLSADDCLQGAPFSGMVEVSRNHHASHQEPLYGPYYADQGPVSNHSPALGRAAVRLAGAWGQADCAVHPSRTHAPENGYV